MNVEQLLYVKLNLAAEPHSLALLSASLHSVLEQIIHSPELDGPLENASSQMFTTLIQKMEETNKRHGVQVSLSYSEGFLKITFAYQGKPWSEEERPPCWSKLGGVLAAVYQVMDHVEYLRHGEGNLLVLAKRFGQGLKV